MKILLTTDTVGGIWRYTTDLAQGLRARNIPCIVATLGPPATPAQRAEIPTSTRNPIELVQTGLPLDWTADSPATLTAASTRLATLTTLLGASSIHLHAPALAQAQFPVPVIAVAHSCVGTWWHTMRPGAPPPPDFAWRIDATAAGLRHATAIIAPSAAHAHLVAETYAIPTPHISHTGTPPAKPSTTPRTRSILTAGRLWDEAKGAAAIDQAAATLDTPIQAAGPLTGPNGNTITLHHMHPLGTLDAPAMAHAYAQAQIFVSMARYEPFGLAVLEAANAGCRLVLLDTPTFRELWPGAATFVPTQAALAPTLTQALDTPGDGGAKAHAARYTLDAMTDATLHLHQQSAHAPSRSPI